jgi:hypothetical protein
MIRENDTGIIILSEENGVPIDMNRFVRHINANLKEDSWGELVSLCRAGCKLMEEKLDRAIIRKRIKFTAERLNPIFPRAPFINLEEIAIKDGRRWITLMKNGEVTDGIDENFYSINYLNEEREAMLRLDEEILKTKVLNFDFSDQNKDPQVSVIYNAGYSLEGERQLRLPESVECRVLAICSSIYYGSKESNELLGLKDKNENKEKKNNSKRESQEELLQSTQKVQIEGELKNMLEGYWFK